MVNGVIDSLIEHIGGMDQRILSAAAKVDYIAVRENRPVSTEDVKLAASDLSWSLSESQIQSVITLLSTLHLVEVK